MRNIILITFVIFLASCGGGSNSSEPIQQNNTPTNTQNNSQTSTQTETETETETKEVIQANFGEVKFGEAKFE